jgi:hypothetical protein
MRAPLQRGSIRSSASTKNTSRPSGAPSHDMRSEPPPRTRTTVRDEWLAYRSSTWSRPGPPTSIIADPLDLPNSRPRGRAILRGRIGDDTIETSPAPASATALVPQSAARSCGQCWASSAFAIDPPETEEAKLTLPRIPASARSRMTPRPAKVARKPPPESATPRVGPSVAGVGGAGSSSSPQGRTPRPVPSAGDSRTDSSSGSITPTASRRFTRPEPSSRSRARRRPTCP